MPTIPTERQVQYSVSSKVQNYARNLLEHNIAEPYYASYNRVFFPVDDRAEYLRFLIRRIVLCREEQDE